MMKSKIHRATVTDANLQYMGSITIDEELIEAAGLAQYEKVHVLDVNNGERFETYVIKGKRASGDVILNGAAARLVQPGDKIIIISYAFYTQEELSSADHQPRTVFVDEKNRIIPHQHN